MMSVPNSINPAAEPSPPPSVSGRLLVVLVLFLSGMFFINELDWAVSTYENYAIPPDQAEEQVAGGSATRKVAYASIGMLGCLLLLVRGRQPTRLCSTSMMMVGAYYVICLASIAWSADPALSLKRVGILTFCLLAILGLVKHLSPRNLLDVPLAIAAVLVVIGLMTEVAWGTFRPFSGGDYRFAGTVHPNTQGSYCAVMTIAAFFGWRDARRYRWLYLLLFCLAGTFLVLTKSRSCLGGCLMGLSAAWWIGTSRATKTFVSLGTPLAVSAGVLAALLLGVEIFSEVDSAVRLGREGLEGGFTALNGRMPLWIDLSSYLAQRPWCGYGYQGFWTPARIVEVSLEQGWTVPTAHSVYLDILLSVGLLGGIPLALAVATAVFRTARRCVAFRDPLDCYAFALFVFALASSVFESGFAQPTSFDSFFTACTMVYALSRTRVLDHGTRGSTTPRFRRLQFADSEPIECTQP